MTKHVFYKPEDGWSGDYIPFYWNGTFYLFYLLDRHSPRGHLDGVPWCLTETSDFVNFTSRGVVLPGGTEQDQDLCVYTGSVLAAQDRFHIFYTGNNPFMRQMGLPEQKVMHAVSDDLRHWTKIPEDTFQAPEGYEPHDWRDPFVYLDERDGQYHMLLAARLKEGALPRRGCTAHLVSSDLKTWQQLPPLWAPESYYTHECPDLFQMGEWYYLIFSEFSDINRTRYVMSKSSDGPWIAPQQDVFDTGPITPQNPAPTARNVIYSAGSLPVRTRPISVPSAGQAVWRCMNCTSWKTANLPAGNRKRLHKAGRQTNAPRLWMHLGRRRPCGKKGRQRGRIFGGRAARQLPL